MGVRSTTVLAPLSALLLACVLTTSCSPDGGGAQADPERLELEAAAGALSASVLRPGAERAFARGGHTLEGGLECTNGPPAAPSAEPGGSGAPADPSPAGDDTEEADGSGGAPGADGAAGVHLAPGAGRTSAPEQDGALLAVHCTGVTGEGEEAVFEGRLDRADLAAREAGDDSLPGNFTGTVAGEQVFELDCFQCEAMAADDGTADGEADAGEGEDEGGSGAETAAETE